MADNEDRNEKTSRGNEWEVVSLTASTYAAAPGPDEVELKDDDKVDLHLQGEAETSSALFMSGHFVFPPSKHENLPLEPEYNEVYDESGGGDVAFEVTSEDGNIPSRKDEKNFSFAGSNVPEEFDGIQYFDDKANKLYVHEKFDEAYGESIDESETLELAEQGANVCPDLSESKSTSKYDNYSPSHLPCEAWWKRRAASFYAHAKEANAFWSVFVAATLMGLVMLGQRWQQERALKLKWQISVNDEVRSRVLAPLFRLKDVIVRGHRHGPLIRGSSTVEG
ncbi:PREDICTED: ATG8-interacting protein 1-like isoform X2 [Lupinus angustifolius]|uniref:ATG8-interacting protein 1-like isoform X2 n=1 Tax=Lupinus angustifolius TaxID=3871 RepID=UPI00092F700A|nr:PREDICTED: ATG8-interacting protein 1-like isoform X2 [Lupinus angustifolius]